MASVRAMLILAALGATAVLFAACGGDDDDTSGRPTPDPNDPTAYLLDADKDALFFIRMDDFLYTPSEFEFNSGDVIALAIKNDVGETPFAELVEAMLGARDLEDVSSLVYRDPSGQVVTNEIPRYSLERQNTVPDLRMIPDEIEFFSEKYHDAFGHLHRSDKIRATTINFARGCENGRFRCSYCSIADLSVNTGDPGSFWDAVRYYHGEFGINLFFEVYDSFTASPRYVNRLLDAMPEDLAEKIAANEIEFMVYARALGLTKQDSISKLKRLGVTRVNIGIDSIDTRMLESHRKNKTTQATNIEALMALEDQGITIHASYILGGLGETKATMANTVEHIADSLDKVVFSSVEVSKLHPLPNSPIWDMIVGYDAPTFYDSREAVDAELKKMDVVIAPQTRSYLNGRHAKASAIDYDALVEDWYAHFTFVDIDEVDAQIAKVDEVILGKGIMTGKNVG